MSKLNALMTVLALLAFSSFMWWGCVCAEQERAVVGAVVICDTAGMEVIQAE